MRVLGKTIIATVPQVGEVCGNERFWIGRTNERISL
jgi:hypothetical protein